MTNLLYPAAAFFLVSLGMPRPIAALRPLLLAGMLAAPLAAGCSDGPVPELRSINPWVRKQWAEDEDYLATYHRRVADLADLRSQAGAMSPDQQASAAAELAQRVQEEQSPVLRAELVRTLGELGASVSQSAVLSAMSDESGHVRIAAAKALGRQPTQEGFQALSRAVESDSDLDVRIAAARELSQFKAFDAPEALRPALDDNDPALQLAAMQSLQSLTGRSEYGNHVPTWRDYLDGNNPAPPPGPTLAQRWQQLWNWY
jgi:HEAT repeat protein